MSTPPNTSLPRPIHDAQTSLGEAASSALEKFHKDTGRHITGIRIDVVSRKTPAGWVDQSAVAHVSITIS